MTCKLACSGLGVPAATALVDLPFLFKTRQHAVQVVLLDAHLRRQLGDRDPGLALHEGESLGCPRATAFTAPRAASARRPARFFASRFSGRSGGAGGFGARARATRPSWTTTARSRARGARAAQAGQRGSCGFETVELIHGGLELPQSIGDLSALVVKEVVHDSSSSLVS